MAKRVLIVEDELELAELVALHLADQGYEVEVANDGRAGLRKATATDWDLIVLDLMLPGIDGLEICRQLRAQPPYTPILMLTARSSELDRVLGLELGADDYLTKPFSVRELVARARAILRRVEALGSSEEDGPEAIVIGELVIDRGARRVRLGDRDVDLTAKEFDLLVQLASHPGRVYTRTQLLDLVWGHGHDAYEHTVNSHINRLRAKLEEDPKHPAWVLTVWGVGYKLAEPVTENRLDPTAARGAVS